MIRITASLLLLLLLPSAAIGDVRDDNRACELNFFKKFRRGVEPQPSNAVEEYCMGLGYWFQTAQSKLPHDPVKSAYWHSKAAEHGNVKAMVTLGYLYEKGHGVAVDVAKAVEYYKKAAEQGDASAMYNLGRLYSLGRGVSKDAVESDKWFKLALQNGSAEAKVHYRDSKEYNETSSAKREAYAEGYKAYQAKDYATAAKLFAEAAAAGNAQAQVSMGELYRLGQGVPKNPATAVEFYRKAALAGNARGQVELGRAYELGEGVKEDWSQAIEWYKKSAEQLNSHGLALMGRAYQFGIGVPQDRAIAVKLFEKADNQGDEQSRFFARWLRVPSNCLGYVDDKEREKFAGICSDPKGITFHSSKERFAWLADAMSKVKIDTFGASSYQQGACGAIGGDFRNGGCYGHGGAIVNPGTQDRYGNNLW